MITGSLTCLIPSKGRVQTFVTTTSVEGIDHQTLKEASTFIVEAGVIKKVN